MKNREGGNGCQNLIFLTPPDTQIYTGRQGGGGGGIHCFVIKRRRDQNNELAVLQQYISSCLRVVTNFLLYLIKIFRREKLFIFSIQTF